jgi:hypothetical protein
MPGKLTRRFTHSIAGGVRYRRRAVVIFGKHDDINGSLSKSFNILMGCLSILTSVMKKKKKRKEMA